MMDTARTAELRGGVVEALDELLTSADALLSIAGETRDPRQNANEVCDELLEIVLRYEAAFCLAMEAAADAPAEDMGLVEVVFDLRGAADALPLHLYRRPIGKARMVARWAPGKGPARLRAVIDRLAQHLERLASLKLRGAIDRPCLSDRDRDYIRVLADAGREALLSSEKVGAGLSRYSGKIGAAAAQKRLRYLEQLGFVYRPDGPRSGWSLTAQGWQEHRAISLV